MKKSIIAIITILSFIGLSFTVKTDDKKVTVMISHEVKDYETWKKGFDANEPNRKAAGFKVLALYRGVENPNLVTVTIEGPSAEAVQKFLSNPDLKTAMEKGGVISAPEVKILNKVQ